MKTITFIKLTAALMLVALANLDAQETPSISQNARIRIAVSTVNRFHDLVYFERNLNFVSTGTLTGSVMALTVDTLKLKITARPGPLAIPLAAVKKLEISRGHIPRGKNVLKGAGIGLLIGGGVGVLVGLKLDDPSSSEMTTSAWMLLGGAVGGGTGLVIGSVLGASISTDRWEEIPLETFRAGLSPRDD